jgi:hypothetical protein
MLCHPLIQIIGMASIIAAIGASKQIGPKAQETSFDTAFARLSPTQDERMWKFGAND